MRRVLRCGALIASGIVLWQPQAWCGGPARHEEAEEAFPRIDSAALIKILEREDVTLLDARGAAAYKQLHIKGAKNLPASAFDEGFELLKKELTREGQIVVVYCSHRTCDDSHRLADRLGEAGIKDVRIFPGGMKEWIEARFPVEGTDAALVTWD
jgi:rhodanese-related sulfurtransferase